MQHFRTTALYKTGPIDVVKLPTYAARHPTRAKAKDLTGSKTDWRLIIINLRLRFNKYGGTKKREGSALRSGRFVQVFIGQEAG